MNSPTITLTLNSRSYHLSASNAQSLRAIPKADRQQLIALLEAIAQQDLLDRQATPLPADSRVNSAASQPSAPPATHLSARPDVQPGSQASHNKAKPSNRATGQPTEERLGRGDADELMARLILEEKRQQKPGLSPKGLYKFIGAATLLIIILVLVF